MFLRIAFIKIYQMRYIRNISLPVKLFVLMAIFFVSCDKTEEEEALPIANYSIFSPSGNEILLKGIPAAIKWYAPLHTTVDIDLYHDSDFVYSIEKAFVTNNIVYMWMIPDHIPDDYNYFIKISDSNDKNHFTINQFSFGIATYVQTLSEFTDDRDGQVYKTSKIGDQWWMAENFRYNSEQGSYWYWDDQAEYEEFGKLYTQGAAIKDAPEGWHLPTYEEWEILESYLGSTAVIALKKNGGTGF